MPNGYHGKILVVDLTTGAIRVDQHDEAWYRTYMGGTNFGMYYILKHMPPGADPLGPDNVLTLMLSVLTGVPFSGQSRMTANAKADVAESEAEIARLEEEIAEIEADRDAEIEEIGRKWVEATEKCETYRKISA